MLYVKLFTAVSWQWYVLIGSITTFLAGVLASYVDGPFAGAPRPSMTSFAAVEDLLGRAVSSGVAPAASVEVGRAAEVLWRPRSVASPTMPTRRTPPRHGLRSRFPDEDHLHDDAGDARGGRRRLALAGSPPRTHFALARDRSRRGDDPRPARALLRPDRVSAVLPGLHGPHGVRARHLRAAARVSRRARRRSTATSASCSSGSSSA